MRSYGKAWFHNNRPEFADEDIRVSKLYAPQQAWWLEVPVRLLEKHPTAHTNLLCENGENLGREFFHLRVPIPYIIKHRHSLDLRRDNAPHKFSLHLSAKPGNLFRDERGVGNVNFSQFVMPKGSKCVVQEPVIRDNAPRAPKITPRKQPSKIMHVFIDIENDLSKEDAYDILKRISDKGYRIEGKAFTAKKEPGAFKTWKPLFQEYNIKMRKTPATGKNAADAKLFIEFGRATGGMQSGDYVCIVGSDQIYGQAVAGALEKGINVWHFCKRVPRWNPGDKKYRIFIIGKPDSWKM